MRLAGLVSTDIFFWDFKSGSIIHIVTSLSLNEAGVEQK